MPCWVRHTAFLLPDWLEGGDSAPWDPTCAWVSLSFLHKLESVLNPLREGPSVEQKGTNLFHSLPLRAPPWEERRASLPPFTLPFSLGRRWPLRTCSPALLHPVALGLVLVPLGSPTKLLLSVKLVLCPPLRLIYQLTPNPDRRGCYVLEPSPPSPETPTTVSSPSHDPFLRAQFLSNQIPFICKGKGGNLFVYLLVVRRAVPF